MNNHRRTSVGAGANSVKPQVSSLAGPDPCAPDKWLRRGKEEKMSGSSHSQDAASSQG